MALYHALKVKANSRMLLATDGQNAIGTSGLADTTTGTKRTSTDASCYVTVTDASAAVKQAQTAMAYQSPGLWTYTLPATVFLKGAGPWDIVVQVYDQTGSGGTLLRTLEATGNETR